MTRVMRENVTGARVVKALRKEPYEERRFQAVNGRLTRSDLTASAERRHDQIPRTRRFPAAPPARLGAADPLGRPGGGRVSGGLYRRQARRVWLHRRYQRRQPFWWAEAAALYRQGAGGAAGNVPHLGLVNIPVHAAPLQQFPVGSATDHPALVRCFWLFL